MHRQTRNKPAMIHHPATDTDFIKTVSERSGETLSLCWHCKTCAGGCPFSESMDYHPNAVIRLVQLGLRREALQCGSIWLCVGCNTCTIQCPNGIDIPAVNSALREMAIEAGIGVGEPNILMFHRAFLETVKKYGKMHEFELMVRCKMHMRNWFDDMGIGFKLFTKGRMEILPRKCRGRHAIRQLINKKIAGGQQ